MRNDTRLLFNAWLERVAELNGVGVTDTAKNFTVTPSIQQTLFEKVQASSAFLDEINLIPVDQQEGEKVGIMITRPIASRTDTSDGVTERKPINPTDTMSKRYRCEQTNFDTALRYALLDMWRHKPEFQTLIRDAIAKRQGLDRMMIGWNGTSVAANTNIVANPSLQDVNKGWIQNVREQTPAQITSHGELDNAAIYFDLAGKQAGKADYANLDALVFDLIQTLEEPFRNAPGLVAICGADLVHDKFMQVYETSNTAIEQNARDILVATRTLGGKPAITVPFFPNGKVVVTTLANLSIYDQAGTARRLIEDQPRLDRVVDFQSLNEAYVVEENGLFVCAENIHLGAHA